MVGKKRQQVTREATEETRQTILRVAHQLFMTYGYRSVTTRQLAEVCGLTQPALYHYFADKEELYLAVVSDEIVKTRGALERLARRSEDVLERLKAVASFLLSRMHYDLSLMLHDVRYEVSAETRAKLHAQFLQGFIEPITTIFADGIQQGVLRDAAQGGLPPVAAAHLFMTMLSSFVPRQQENASARDQHLHQLTSAETCVRVLLYGLGRANS
jgi:AcrR family transcriptional regulator